MKISILQFKKQGKWEFEQVFVDEPEHAITRMANIVGMAMPECRVVEVELRSGTVVASIKYVPSHLENDRFVGDAVPL